jgi:hypothetical protein
VVSDPQCEIQNQKLDKKNKLFSNTLTMVALARGPEDATQSAWLVATPPPLYRREGINTPYNIYIYIRFPTDFLVRENRRWRDN